jgi:glutaminase
LENVKMGYETLTQTRPPERGGSEELEALLREAESMFRGKTEGGAKASYIPELANADEKLFSISAAAMSGEVVSAGDRVRFSMQSISKVATLAFAVERLGEREVFSRVGMEPCSEPFNSIAKLELESAVPLNPFINAGAIAVASLVAENFGTSSLAELLAFASRLAGLPHDQRLEVNEKIFASESGTADRNRSLAYFMHGAGALSHNVEDTLRLYFNMCSAEASTRDLAVTAATIAGGGVCPVTGEHVVSPRASRVLLGLMSVCGLYNESGKFAIEVGAPGKSGVSGGIMAAVPGKLGLAVYSPPIDAGGTSVAGMKALAYLSDKMKLLGI